MNRFECRDGRTLEWTGHNICLCVTCEQLFNSVAAFDAHLKRPKGKSGQPITGSRVKHDYARMPRNNRGYLVTSLKEPDGTRMRTS